MTEGQRLQSAKWHLPVYFSSGKNTLHAYTLLCIKWIKNKDLLCSTGNCIHHLVMTYVEKNWKYIYVYITEYICIYNWIYYIGWGFSCGSDGKESACNVGHLGSIPELGRSPGEGNGYPLQYSGLENSIDRGAWQATVHGVAKSQTDIYIYIYTHIHTYIHISESLCYTCETNTTL